MDHVQPWPPSHRRTWPRSQSIAQMGPIPLTLQSDAVRQKQVRCPKCNVVGSKVGVPTGRLLESYCRLRGEDGCRGESSPQNLCLGLCFCNVFPLRAGESMLTLINHCMQTCKVSTLQPCVKVPCSGLMCKDPSQDLPHAARVSALALLG